MRLDWRPSFQSACKFHFHFARASEDTLRQGAGNATLIHWTSYVCWDRSWSEKIDFWEAFLFCFFCTCSKAGLDDLFRSLPVPPAFPSLLSIWFREGWWLSLCSAIPELRAKWDFRNPRTNETCTILPLHSSSPPASISIPWRTNSLVENLVPLNPEKPGMQHLLGNTIWFLWIRSISLNIGV